MAFRRAPYTTGTASYGLNGDPTRPVSGRHYGYLLRAVIGGDGE